MQDKIIYETENFVLTAVSRPHVSREEGGHLKITPKVRVTDRTKLSPQLAVEMAWLTMLAGESMEVGLAKTGIDIGLINYQENKNWGVFNPEGPYLHIHLYGRAKDAKIQKYGDAIQAPRRETGFYDYFEPLNDRDIDVIKGEIDALLKTDKYNKTNWRFDV